MWIAYLPCHERSSRPPVSDVAETGAFQIPGPPSKQWMEFILAVLSCSGRACSARYPGEQQDHAGHRKRQRWIASCIMLFTCSVDSTAKQTREQRQQEQARVLIEKILFLSICFVGPHSVAVKTSIRSFELIKVTIVAIESQLLCKKSQVHRMAQALTTV